MIENFRAQRVQKRLLELMSEAGISTTPPDDRRELVEKLAGVRYVDLAGGGVEVVSAPAPSGMADALDRIADSPIPGDEEASSQPTTTPSFMTLESLQEMLNDHTEMLTVLCETVAALAKNAAYIRERQDEMIKLVTDKNQFETSTAELLRAAARELREDTDKGRAGLGEEAEEVMDRMVAAAGRLADTVEAPPDDDDNTDTVWDEVDLTARPRRSVTKRGRPPKLTADEKELVEALRSEAIGWRSIASAINEKRGYEHVTHTYLRNRDSKRKA